MAASKTEGIVYHNELRRLIGNLAEHVETNNANVHITIQKLSDHICGALEPDLQVW